MRRRQMPRPLTRIATASAIAIGLTVGVVARLAGIGLAPILSPSMRPALDAGDLALVRDVDVDALDVGTVLLLAGGLDATDGVVAHRIVALERAEGRTVVRTRGDANVDVDPRAVTLVEPRARIVIGHVPLLGHLAVTLGTTAARVTLLAAVLVALVATIDRAAPRRREERMHTLRRPRRPRRPVATLLATASVAAALVVLTDVAAGPPTALPAAADATGPTVLAAALEEFGIADPDVAVVSALEILVDDAIAVGVMDHGVLTVVAGQDPVSVPCFIGAHLRRERERWADVGPVWSRAHERLGLEPGGCTPGDDAPCGLVLRLRLMTDAARELAGREECDLDCAHRLQRLQRRLDTTAQAVDALDIEQLGAGTDAARDADRLVAEARTVLDVVGERIRVAEEEAPVPDPDFEDECGTDDAPGTTTTNDPTEGATP